jgi:hypothetical protein
MAAQIFLTNKTTNNTTYIIMIDEMIRENWAGMMGSVGNQIKNMMQSQGVAYNQCPQQPRTLSIRNPPSIKLTATI